MNKKDEEIIENIVHGSHEAISLLYQTLKPQFFSFFKTYPLEREELKDIYQETMISFYNSLRDNKYNDKKSSIKTYIFAIGKYKVIDFIKRSQKASNFIAEDEVIPIEMDEIELSKRQQLLKTKFQQLGEKCQEVITMFYYHGLNLKEIAYACNYKDVNTVKSMKSRCMRQLRELMNIS